MSKHEHNQGSEFNSNHQNSHSGHRPYQNDYHKSRGNYNYKQRGGFKPHYKKPYNGEKNTGMAFSNKNPNRYKKPAYSNRNPEEFREHKYKEKFNQTEQGNENIEMPQFFNKNKIDEKDTNKPGLVSEDLFLRKIQESKGSETVTAEMNQGYNENKPNYSNYNDKVQTKEYHNTYSKPYGNREEKEHRGEYKDHRGEYKDQVS